MEAPTASKAALKETKMAANMNNIAVCLCPSSALFSTSTSPTVSPAATDETVAASFFSFPSWSLLGKRKVTDALPTSICGWRGKINDLETHTSECPYITVPCTCVGCEKTVPRGELGGHEAACEHRQVACANGCGALVKVCDLEAHKSSICPRRPSLCPNAGCGATLPHDELQTHRDEQCQQEEVACPHAESLGCEHRCARCDMATHRADGQAHIQAMMGVVASLQKTAQEQQTKMQQLETENKQLKQSIGWVHDTCTWDVEGYKIPSFMLSPVFSVGGFEFKLSLDSGQLGEGKDFTGLYLHLTKGWKTPVKWELQIINANDRSITTSRSNELTFGKLEARGASKLLSNEAMKTYIKDGKVTVRAKVSVKMPDNLASAQVLV